MKTWFVTGASRGLGAEIVRAALAAGDRVIGTARKRDDLAHAFADTDHGTALEVDVTKPASIAAAVEHALARFDRIDVLVNNAGYGLLGAFEELSVAAIAKQFETNLFGAFAVTRAVLPAMRARRSGHIISISSICGVTGFDLCSIYCATKFALGGWSESLSLELARFGIHATVVYPGTFRTDFLDETSVHHGDLAIADYAALTAAADQSRARANHQQAGDPVAFGHAIVELSRAAAPPVRFAAGSDAIGVMADRAHSLTESTDAWRALSRSTDLAR